MDGGDMVTDVSFSENLINALIAVGVLSAFGYLIWMKMNKKKLKLLTNKINNRRAFTN